MWHISFCFINLPPFGFTFNDFAENAIFHQNHFPTGATVNFQPASPDTMNLNNIDIYPPDHPTNDLTLSDPDGYVSVGNMVTTKDSGTYHLTAGMIQIYKDLSGKEVEINVIDHSDKVVASTRYVFILNQDIDPPKSGDVRSFQTNVNFVGVPNSYQVRVHDILKPVE
jgi:hypothetical protein